MPLYEAFFQKLHMITVSSLMIIMSSHDNSVFSTQGRGSQVGTPGRQALPYKSRCVCLNKGRPKELRYLFWEATNWNVICNYNRVNNSQEKSWCKKKRGINWSLGWKLEAVSQALGQFGCRTANCSIWSKETQPTMLWTRHSTPATPQCQGDPKLKCIYAVIPVSDREQKKKLLIKVSHSLESRVTTVMVMLDIT